MHVQYEPSAHLAGSADRARSDDLPDPKDWPQRPIPHAGILLNRYGLLMKAILPHGTASARDYSAAKRIEMAAQEGLRWQNHADACAALLDTCDALERDIYTRRQDQRRKEST